MHLQFTFFFFFEGLKKKQNNISLLCVSDGSKPGEPFRGGVQAVPPGPPP